MNNIAHVSDSMMCSTCGACAAVCPKDAVSFSTTSAGRIFATVGDGCVDCGLCRHVCPSDPVDNTVVDQYNAGVIGGVFVGRSTDSRYYCNAQSGGVCTTLIDYLFKSRKIDGALMVRMKYGKTPIVEAFVADENTDLTQSQKSCYSPVPLLAALKQCSEKKSLAVVGLPCQMKGITAMQGLKKFSNIKYRIGLVCEGILGLTAQEVLISYSELKMSNNQKIDWKRKTVPTISGGGCPRTQFDKNDGSKMIGKTTNIGNNCIGPMNNDAKLRLNSDTLHPENSVNGVLGRPGGVFFGSHSHLQ